NRPSVVFPFLDDVQLIASAGTVLGFPQKPGSRIERKTLLAAGPVRPDLGQDARLSNEGIVRGRGAIGRNVNDFAEIGVETLRNVPRRGIRTVANRNEKAAVRRDGDAAAGF